MNRQVKYMNEDGIRRKKNTYVLTITVNMGYPKIDTKMREAIREEREKRSKRTYIQTNSK